MIDVCHIARLKYWMVFAAVILVSSTFAVPVLEWPNEYHIEVAPVPNHQARQQNHHDQGFSLFPMLRRDTSLGLLDELYHDALNDHPSGQLPDAGHHSYFAPQPFDTVDKETEREEEEGSTPQNAAKELWMDDTKFDQLIDVEMVGPDPHPSFPTEQPTGNGDMRGMKRIAGEDSNEDKAKKQRVRTRQSKANETKPRTKGEPKRRLVQPASIQLPRVSVKSLVERELAMIQNSSNLPEKKQSYLRRMKDATKFTDLEIATLTAGLCYKSNRVLTSNGLRFDAQFSLTDIKFLAKTLNRTPVEIIQYYEAYFDDFHIQFKLNRRLDFRQHPACLVEHVVPKGAFSVVGGMRRMDDIVRTDQKFYEQLQAKLVLEHVNARVEDATAIDTAGINQNETDITMQQDARDMETTSAPIPSEADEELPTPSSPDLPTEEDSLFDQQLRKIQNPESVPEEKRQYFNHMKLTFPNITDHELSMLTTVMCFFTDIVPLPNDVKVRFHITHAALQGVSTQMEWPEEEILRFYESYLTRFTNKTWYFKERSTKDHSTYENAVFATMSSHPACIDEQIRTVGKGRNRIRKVKYIFQAYPILENTVLLETAYKGLNSAWIPKQKDGQKRKRPEYQSLFDHQLHKIKNPDTVPQEKRDYFDDMKQSFFVNDTELSILTATMCYFTYIRHRPAGPNVVFEFKQLTINELSDVLKWKTEDVVRYYESYLLWHTNLQKGRSTQSQQRVIYASLSSHPACIDEEIRVIGETRRRPKTVGDIFDPYPPFFENTMSLDFLYNSIQPGHDDEGKRRTGR